MISNDVIASIWSHLPLEYWELLPHLSRGVSTVVTRMDRVFRPRIGFPENPAQDLERIRTHYDLYRIAYWYGRRGYTLPTDWITRVETLVRAWNGRAPIIRDMPLTRLLNTLIGLKGDSGWFGDQHAVWERVSQDPHSTMLIEYAIGQLRAGGNESVLGDLHVRRAALDIISKDRASVGRKTPWILHPGLDEYLNAIVVLAANRLDLYTEEMTRVVPVNSLWLGWTLHHRSYRCLQRLLLPHFWASNLLVPEVIQWSTSHTREDLRTLVRDPRFQRAANTRSWPGNVGTHSIQALPRTLHNIHAMLRKYHADPARLQHVIRWIAGTQSAGQWSDIPELPIIMIAIEFTLEYRITSVSWAPLRYSGTDEIWNHWANMCILHRLPSLHPENVTWHDGYRTMWNRSPDNARCNRREPGRGGVPYDGLDIVGTYTQSAWREDPWALGYADGLNVDPATHMVTTGSLPMLLDPEPEPKPDSEPDPKPEPVSVHTDDSSGLLTDIESSDEDWIPLPNLVPDFPQEGNDSD
jgi:hypothetical protein